MAPANTSSFVAPLLATDADDVKFAVEAAASCWLVVATVAEDASPVAAASDDVEESFDLGDNS